MLDVTNIIQSGGLLLIALIIFAESGMFVGFFFPGDTLLLSAGIFAAQGKLELATLLPVVAIAAILGDNIGYQIGRRFGRHLFDRKDSVIFSKHHLHQAEAFFARFGSRAMLIAHFVPVVRTFAPAVAGTAEMDYKRFFIYDAIGDIAWAVLVTMVGYWFGTKIPNIDRYILLAVAFVMLATLGPAVYHLVKATRNKRAGSGEKS
jgi:membrane-associated protein